MLEPSFLAKRHREFAQAFTDVAEQVQDWDAPTPVKGWKARDVVNHLIEWLPPVLKQATGITLPSSPAALHDDPIAAWEAHCELVQAIFDGEQACKKTKDGPFVGSTVAEMLDRIYSADVFMHRWDLAASAGVDAKLDPAFAGELFEGLTTIETVLRDSGEYGPRVEISDDADIVTKLVGFIGRDPEWVPKSGS